LFLLPQDPARAGAASSERACVAAGKRLRVPCAAMRTAVISGASSGIGVAIARELVKQGARVAIGARRIARLQGVADELRALGGEVFAAPLDVADAATIETFFEASERELGVADLIINNAAHSLPHALHEYPPELLRSEFATNVLGATLLSRRGLSALLASGKPGDVVFMTSDAVRHPRPGQLSYGASKAALENLADGLALELEGSGVRVLKLRIGPTWSEFGAGWPQDPAEMLRRVQYWREFGLRDGRLPGVLLSAENVAQALVWAVSQPPGVWIDTIEIQPAAPARARQGGESCSSTT
jgi:NADP-dependent 3-hydroxy acid dehydrogenase YdfG